MIDLRLLKKKSDIIRKKILQKNPNFPVDELIIRYEALCNARLKAEELNKQQNLLAEKGKFGQVDLIRQEAKDLKLQIEKFSIEVKKIEEDFENLYLLCPNLPQDDLDEGGKENNKVIATWGEKPLFGFEPQSHFELVSKNQYVDFAAGTRIAKSGFIFYKANGAKLLYNLAMWIIQHNESHGFELVLPPYLVSKATAKASSNYPVFKDEIFTCTEDNLYLVPTAEVALAGLYIDHIFQESELPIRMTAWTSCFRREAGGYGAHERGLMRIHQFEKVELFTLCTEEHTKLEQEKMLCCAESILKKLGLHYQISLLATGDCSFASSKTYDIEVWLPGTKEYREVSSVSRCDDFQARRGNIRYRNKQDQKLSFVHTLNGSSLALPRLMIALIETYQKPNGEIDSDHIKSLLTI